MLALASDLGMIVLTLRLHVSEECSDLGVHPHDVLLADHTHVLRRVMGVDVLRAKAMDQIAREPRAWDALRRMPVEVIYCC